MPAGAAPPLGQVSHTYRTLVPAELWTTQLVLLLSASPSESFLQLLSQPARE